MLSLREFPRRLYVDIAWQLDMFSLRSNSIIKRSESVLAQVSECRLLRGGSMESSVVRSTKSFCSCADVEYMSPNGDAIFSLRESDIILLRIIAICS